MLALACLAAAAALGGEAPGLSQGLVAHYTFDKDSSDASGNGHNAENHGAKAVAQGTLIISLLILAIARDRSELLLDMDFRRSATIMMWVVVVIAWWGLVTYVWAHLADFRKVMSGADDRGGEDA